MFIKNLLVSLFILVTLVGCGRDVPPYEIWVDSTFQDHWQESDAVLAGIKEWNDKLAPRGTRGFIFKGFREDSYDSGDSYDDWIQIYRTRYDQMTISELKGEGLKMYVDPVTGELATPPVDLNAPRKVMDVASGTATAPSGKYDDIYTVGLASPRNDVNIFCERLADNQDPRTFDEEQHAVYIDSIRKTVLHELGHVLNLLHSDSDKDIMWPYLSNIEHLSKGDINAYCFSNECN